MIPGLKTQQSTIVVQQGQRTIFTDHPEGTEHFRAAIEQRVNQISQEIRSQIRTVMIGDIHADSPDVNPTQAGACTRYMLETFSRTTSIVANPGKSQIALGETFWQQQLKSLGILQLNLAEIRMLLSAFLTRDRLIDIINWLNQQLITAVITLDRLGAVATYKDGKDGVILASSVELGEDVIDTTGAGDAFAAALASQLQPGFFFDDLLEAMTQARTWAAYACRYLGGSANCPTQKQLMDFEQNIANQEQNFLSVEVIEPTIIEPILQIIDKAY
ncbi:MAG: PfkB family carbohydrate kinase [Microcoleaceae cyanobacterium]